MTFFLEGKKWAGRGERLGPTEVSGRFLEPLPEGREGRLVVDCRRLGPPVSRMVIVASQRPLARGARRVRFRVAGADFREEERWIQLYVATLWEEITSRVPSAERAFVSHSVTGVFEKQEIVEIFAQLLSPPRQCHLVVEGAGPAVRLEFESRKRGGAGFRTIGPSLASSALHRGARAFLFMAEGFRQYLFACRLRESSPGHIETSIPFFLLASSIRKEERFAPRPGSMWVEIPLPFPSGAVLRKEIIDISPGGFSFRCEPEASYFLPGTPIGHMRILQKGRDPYSTSGQIRHVTPITPEPGETFLKIGVQFQISNRAFSKGYLRSGAPARPSRSAGEGEGAKTRESSALQTMRRMLRAGLRLSGQEASAGKQGGGAPVTLFRHANPRQQEIVGLLDTTWRGEGRRTCTAVVVPPPYGKRKESLGMFAHYLIDRLRRQNHDAAVVRYDAVNALGESYKEPECRHPGMEMRCLTLSQGTEDVLAVLDFVENNEFFLASRVVLVSFSLGALLARKAIVKDERRRVHLWAAPMGVTDMGSLMFNISGGIDYFRLFEEGKEIGDVTVLGSVVQGDRFCRDALQGGFVSMEDALADMRRIDIPVIWLYGMHDAWIAPEGVDRLLGAKKGAPSRLRVLPTGHLPLNGQEALKAFDALFEEIWPHIGDGAPAEYTPNLLELNERQEIEWQRIPRERVPSKRRYWASYLLGAREDEIGYDVLRYCEEYRRFIQDQLDQLAPEPGDLVADMGCGTGNLVLQYLEGYDGDPAAFPSFVLVDIVAEALTRIAERCRALCREKGVSTDRFEYRELDLDLHPALPMVKFIRGEYAGPEQLKGQIPGLTDYSVDLWRRDYGPRLHGILRGKRLTPGDLDYLAKRFPDAEVRIIREFNLACRYLRRVLFPKAPGAPGSGEGDGKDEVPRLALLRISLADPNFRLPFPDGHFDRIVASLLLPYLKNPMDTFGEFCRALKPGGVMVVSSMKPDADMSKIYVRMIQRIGSGELGFGDAERERLLRGARDFANAVAHLLQLVEERRFRVFQAEELIDMAQSCGLEGIRLSESYGDPPQAYILRAGK